MRWLYIQKLCHKEYNLHVYGKLHNYIKNCTTITLCCSTNTSTELKTMYVTGFAEQANIISSEVHSQWFVHHRFVQDSH